MVRKLTIRRAGRRAAHAVGLEGRARRRASRWTAAAFRDFIPAAGSHDELIRNLTSQVVRLERHAARGWEAELTSGLLAACGPLAGAQVGATPRSYVDVSAQVAGLRILVDHLAPRASATPLELASAVVTRHAESRPALIVQGDLMLDDGDVEGAIDVARRALRIQAVCITAQELLMRAYTAKRDAGSEDPELGIVDYDLTKRFCPLPFEHLSTGFEGKAFACSCPAWLPFPVGNVLEAETPDEIWNSDAAQEIRRSILDGDFSYCSRTQCSYMLARKLPLKDEVSDPVQRRYIDEHVTVVDEAPKLLEVNHDATCNLACPSCRHEIVGSSPAEQAEYTAAADRVLLPLMKRMDGLLYISGGGEALASRHCRSILRALNREEFPRLSVYLITNGQLLTPKRWAAFPNLPEMLNTVSISVDAACADTYAKVRRPGRWHVLMRNFEYIRELRRTGEIPQLELNFVVQGANFREMLPFVELGEQVEADRLWFQRLVNYGSYDEATYLEIDVCSPRHPDHEELLETLRHPSIRRREHNLNMLLGLLPEFVESDETLAIQW